MRKEKGYDESRANCLGKSFLAFDAVFEFNTFHHIENYQEAIKEVYRVLKNKGSFYVLDVSKRFLNFIILKIDSGQSLFTKEEFTKKLRENDFKVIYSKHNYFFAVKSIKNARQKRDKKSN